MLQLLATRTLGFLSAKLFCSSDLLQVFDLGFYHLTISQNHLGWRRPLRSSGPSFDGSLPCQLDHGKCHIQIQDSVFTCFLHEVSVKPFLYFGNVPLKAVSTAPPSLVSSVFVYVLCHCQDL